MLAIFCDIAWDVRHFNYVIDDKGRQRLHSRELIRLVEWQIRAVYAYAFKELILLGERFKRGIPSQGEHVFLALQQAAGTVFFRRV